MFLSVLYLSDFSKNITGIDICLKSVNPFGYSFSDSFHKHNGFLHLQLPALTRGRSCGKSKNSCKKVVINMNSISYTTTLIVGFLLYYLFSEI